MKLSLKLLAFSISLILLILIPNMVIAQPYGNNYEWWNTSWKYRVGFNTTSSTVDRTNWPVEMWVNFTDILLQKTGQILTFDNNSLRLTEYDSSTYELLFSNVSFQFDRPEDYDAQNNAVGIFVFMLNGTTAADETRDFFIYFDTNDTPKEAPVFIEEISYSSSGEEFYVNNSYYWAYIDTNRGDTTSGIYRVNMSDGGELFWTASSEHPGEYIKYNDTINAFTYNLTNNYTVVYSGPSRYVIEQEGPELNWTTSSTSDQAHLIKRYYFYPGIQWVKIEHVLIADEDITRQSFYDPGPPPVWRPGPMTVEQGRFFGYYTSDGTGADPYSWYSSNSTTIARGIGVININESGTTNFRATLDSTPGVNYRIGIGLTQTSITSGNSISETAVLYFDNTTLAVETKNLRDRFNNALEISMSGAEQWNVTLDETTDHPYYNRNETMIITTAITEDYYNLTRYVNATLNVTADVVELFDDGSGVDLTAADGNYTGSYNFSDSAPVGLWNSEARAYDFEYQYLNISIIEFYVTDVYFVNSTILNPDGIIDRFILANLTVMNFRNDTGINYADIECEWNTTVFSPDIEANDTIGNYTINFTGPPYAGNFTLNCNASRNSNLGVSFADFIVEEPKTFMDTDMLPDQYNYTQVIANLSESFIWNVTLFNNDNGTAYDFNITIDVPPFWLINGTENTTMEELGDVPANATLIRLYNITVPESTYSGNYTINATSDWRNPDNSTNSTMDTSYAIVASNIILERLPDSFDYTVFHGFEEYIGDISLNSTGNDPVYDITFNVTNGNFSTINTSAILLIFDPENLADMDHGNVSIIAVNVSVPLGYPPGWYPANITINTTNNGNHTVSLNVTVPLNRTWNVSTTYCNITATQPVGTVCIVDVNNTGNVPVNLTVNVNFTETPVGYNEYTRPNVTTINLTPQESYPLEFEFDATGAGEGSFATNYTVNGTQPGIIPDYINITVNLTTFLGPWVVFYMNPMEIPQMNNVLVNATVQDRSVVGVMFTQINVSIPNGTFFEENMSYNYWYIDGSGFNATVWTLEFPINDTLNWGTTELRGNYTVTVESYDSNTISDSKNDTFVTYVNITIISQSLDSIYEQGETGNVYYNSTYINNSAIDNVTNTITIKRPDGYLLQLPQTFVSNDNGTINPQPQFEIMSDAPLGVYNLTTNSTYFDNITKMWVNYTTESNFTVQPYVSLSEFSAAIDTTVVWYPTSTMTFLVTTYLNSVPVDPDSMNLTIYQGPPQLDVVYTGYDLSNMTRLLRSGYPYYQAVDMGTPSSGDYWALLSASRGGTYTFVQTPFRVATGGPYDVYVTPDTNEVAPGNNLPFTLVIWNMGEFGQDVDIQWWITDAANTTQFQFHNFPAYTPGLTNTTIAKNYTTAYISSDKSEGEYYINVLVNYSLVEPPKFARAPFTVTAAAAPWCGDNICNGNETIFTCPGDCYCGNGVCDPGESADTCFDDCGFIGPGLPPGVPGVSPAAPAGVPGLNITAYPEEVNVERGQYREDWNHVTVTVENTGSVVLHNVTLNITGVDAGWMTISPILVENLTAADSIIFDLWFNVPGDAQARAYDLLIQAQSDEANDFKSSKLRVFESTKALYQYEIDKLYEKLAELEAQVASLRAQGYDPSAADDLLDQARSRLEIAQGYVDDDLLDQAKYPIVGARNLLEEAERILATLQRPTVITELLLPWWVYLLLLLFVIVLIVLFYFIIRSRRSKRLMEETYLGAKEYPERITREVKKRKPEEERISRLEAALKTLKRQHDEGLLSDEVYNELKEKQEEQLKKLK